MAPWAESQGHSLRYTRLFAGDSPPGPSDYELLIVMGGPMGVHDEGRIPWLAGEKRALRSALEADKAVLGVCLGAQLIADALGAPVTRNRLPEIGWHEVRLGGEAGRTWMADAFPPAFTAFHWHGDTFGIPAGAVALGSSAACANQGFLFGERVLALQFHPEATESGVEDLLRECGEELRPGPYVQDADSIRAGMGRAPEANAMMIRACGILGSARLPR